MAEPGVSSEVEGFRLQQALDATRPNLQELATAEHAKAWLSPYLRTQEGTRKLYSLLQQHVSKDAFLKQLTYARSQLLSASGAAAAAPTGQGEVLQPNGGWWQVPAREITAHEPACLEFVESDELTVPNIEEGHFTGACEQVCNFCILSRPVPSRKMPHMLLFYGRCLCSAKHAIFSR